MKTIISLIGISLCLSATGLAQLSIDSTSSELSFSCVSVHHFGDETGHLDFRSHTTENELLLDNNAVLSTPNSSSRLTSFDNSLSGMVNRGGFPFWNSLGNGLWPVATQFATVVQNCFLLTNDHGSYLDLGFKRLATLSPDRPYTSELPEKISTQEDISNDREIPWTVDSAQVYQPVSIADAYQNHTLSF